MNLEEILIDCVKKVNGNNVLVYDMEGRNPFYDKMILASVDSLRQADAIVSYIEDGLKDTEYNIRHIEGKNSPWVLVDCNSVILSVFTKEEREHFQLEKVYMEYKSTKIDD
ncbi:MAG: ribosome silencing factor [Acholeplasmatales bacterium]|nr:ribosome silencing factor [Acholeplasmatales bacterium]